MRKVVSFLIGFLIGGLVGGATALLLAPYAGAELQEQIRARIEELKEAGQEAAAARQVELETQLEAFKSGGPITIETTSE